MSSKPISPLQKAWYQWKALKLPWRKRFLVGLDLEGNTFWEFRDALSSHQHRMRRIVKCHPSTHYSEVKISPQWHQWLRHTRIEPPSLIEQSQDLIRQENLKVLAAQADARWAAKPSLLNLPGKPKERSLSPLPVPDLLSKLDKGASAEQASGDKHRVPAIEQLRYETETKSAQLSDGKLRSYENSEGKLDTDTTEKKPKEDPWKKARVGPSEEWQPASWNGNLGHRRG